MSKEKDFFEELEDTKKVSNYEESVKENNSNTIASILKIIGWIILVIGFILGFVTGRNEYDDFDFTLALTTWLIYGGVFLGIYAMGEVIQILHDIRAELRNKK